MDSVSIRRLGPGDEPVLELLAREDADFDLDDRGKPGVPLASAAAAAYLADPGIFHVVASVEGTVVGFASGHTLRLRHGDAVEFLLYEIGVRAAHRRTGIGRGLLEATVAHMKRQGMRYAWVLADNSEAVEFYRACGFEASDDMAVFLGKTLTPRE